MAGCASPNKRRLVPLAAAAIKPSAVGKTKWGMSRVTRLAGVSGAAVVGFSGGVVGSPVAAIVGDAGALVGAVVTVGSGGASVGSGLMGGGVVGGTSAGSVMGAVGRALGV